MIQERKASPLAGLLERPLSPRSLIGSLLLGMRRPRMPGARLVEWCALFGVAEGTARVALSRMVDRGELTTTDGMYELAGHLRSRQPAQDWSLHPALGDWDGSWLLGVVAPGPRSAPERAALRDAGRRLRLVDLREGVWTRPDNLPRAAGAGDAWQTADAQCTWWSARPDKATVADVVARFEPGSWAARARMLHGHLESATAAVDAADGATIADAFVVGALALRHVRADPLLPTELCERNWPGADLRATYREYQAAFSTAVREWFRTR
jgi:phenylacetic acid degradation operon negative regulatory protein